jgi:amidase
MGPDYGEFWQGAAIDHALTRSVRDSAALLDYTAGPDPGAPYYPPPPAKSFLEEAGRDPEPLRIAWTTTPFLGSAVHPDCVAAVQDAVRLLTDLGHEVVEAAPTVDGPAFSRAFLTMVCAETAAELREASELLGRRATREAFEPATWALGLLGKALRADELSAALRYLGRISRGIGGFFTDVAVLVTPTLAVPPFEIGALQPTPRERLLLETLGRFGSGRLMRSVRLLDELAAQVFEAVPYTPVFNATGQPAMSVPLHWSRSGLPIGIHFVGRYADEATLFQLAGQLERARPWFARLPPLARERAPVEAPAR